MFIAGNCRSLCRRSKLTDELNRKRAWVLSATALGFREDEKASVKPTRMIDNLML